MKDIISFVLVLLLIAIVLVLISVGYLFLIRYDTTDNITYDKIAQCKEQALILSCEELLQCDRECDDLDFYTHSTNCHTSLTNPIIVRCEK